MLHGPDEIILGLGKVNLIYICNLYFLQPASVTPRRSRPDGGVEPTIEARGDSGEYTMPREFPPENEVVYAVLEQEGTDDSTDKKYIDVVQ